MSLQKTLRVLGTFAVALLVWMAVACAPVRAADTGASRTPPEATSATTVRVTVQPTVIASFELILDGNGLGSYTIKLTGNSDCRTHLMRLSEGSAASPQVLHFLTYL